MSDYEGERQRFSFPDAAIDHRRTFPCSIHNFIPSDPSPLLEQLGGFSDVPREPPFDRWRYAKERSSGELTT